MTAPPDTALTNHIAAAFAAKDERRVLDLLRSGAVDDHDFCGSTAMSAIEIGSTAVLRYVFEEAKLELSAESCMMMLLEACRQDQPAAAAYLAERCWHAGATRLDSYTVMLEKFEPARHIALADASVAAAADRRDALDSFMQATGATRQFAALGRIIDLGADVNADGGKVLSALGVSPPEALKENKDEYLALIDKFLGAGYHPDLYLDALLISSAMLSAGNLQFRELPELLLQHGADPWYDRNEGWRQLPDIARKEGDLSTAERWEEVFTAAKDNITKTAAHVFDTLFGDDFRLADLRPVAIGSETGLMLAAKARRIDKVMAAARREGGALTAEDLLDHRQNQRSLLSRAADRGDQAALLDITYWQGKTPQLLQRLGETLHEDDKARIDLSQMKAGYDRWLLKSGAARYKLKPA